MSTPSTSAQEALADLHLAQLTNRPKESANRCLFAVSRISDILGALEEDEAATVLRMMSELVALPEMPYACPRRTLSIQLSEIRNSDNRDKP